MSVSSATGLYKTGDTAPYTGRYEFVRYTDGSTAPAPTSEERIIPLSRGETFPPVKSCNKGAWRRLVG
jgi:YjzC-like protein